MSCRFSFNYLEKVWIILVSVCLAVKSADIGRPILMFDGSTCDR